MDELTTSIVGIDFPNDDKSKSNRRMECMLCHRGDPVELRPEPKNPHDSNAIAIWSERGVQLGYVSAERAPLIGKRMQIDEVVAVFKGMHGHGAYIRIRFGGGLPTLPPAPAEAHAPPPLPPRPMRTAARPVYDPHAFYPDEDGSEFGAQNVGLGDTFSLLCETYTDVTKADSHCEATGLTRRVAQSAPLVS